MQCTEKGGHFRTKPVTPFCSEMNSELTLEAYLLLGMDSKAVHMLISRTHDYVRSGERGDEDYRWN